MTDIKMEEKIYTNLNNSDHRFLGKNLKNYDKVLLDKNSPCLLGGEDDKPAIVVSPNSPCLSHARSCNNSVPIADDACNPDDKDEVFPVKQDTLVLTKNSIFGKLKRDSDLSDNYSSDISDMESDEHGTSPVKGNAPKESKWMKLRKAIRWHPFTQSYKKEYPFIQLAGHAGSFKPGNEGTILKCSSKREVECLVKLQTDVLRPYVPKFYREVEKEDGLNIEMQDLLHDFESPSFVMDCKMGIRTYLEEEVNQAGQPRQDLYNKMISVDPSEPTEEENRTCSCTKSRYMIWREQLSSTATLGFRIEGIKRGDNNPDKDFKKIKTGDDVSKVFLRFIENRKDLQAKYIQKLNSIREALLESVFFKNYELIGSSLLFVHDASGKAGVWLIDFGKTVALRNGTTINHRSPWTIGNHEDGYYIGLDNIEKIWNNLAFEKEINPL